MPWERVVDWWRDLPPDWQRWLSADFPSWVGGVAGVAAFLLMIRTLRQPPTHLQFAPSTWTAIRGEDGLVAISGRLFAQPFAGGYAISSIEARINRSLLHNRERHPISITALDNQTFQGARQITIRLGSHPLPANDASVKVEAWAELRDGSKAYMKHRVPIVSMKTVVEDSDSAP